jgi:hypothetical protein
MTTIPSLIHQAWHHKDKSPLPFNLRSYLTLDEGPSHDVPESVVQLKALMQGVSKGNKRTLFTDWVEYLLSEKSLTFSELSDMAFQLYAPYLSSKWNDFKTESSQLLTEGLASEFSLLRESIANNNNLAVLILNELITNGVLILWCAHQYRETLPSAITYSVHQGTYSVLWADQSMAYNHILQFPETGTIQIDYGYDDFTNEAVYLEDCIKPWYMLRLTKNLDEQNRINATVNSYHALLHKASALIAQKYVRYVNKFTIAGATKIDMKPWHAKTDMVIITNSKDVLTTWKQSKHNLDAVLEVINNTPTPEEALSCSLHENQIRTFLFLAKRPEFAKFDINFM